MGTMTGTIEMMNRISELVDIIAMEKPLDWESVDYESTKMISISSMLEQYYNLKMKTPDILDESVISIMSYLTLENMMLWIEIEQMKQGLKK